MAHDAVGVEIGPDAFTHSVAPIAEIPWCAAFIPLLPKSLRLSVAGRVSLCEDTVFMELLDGLHAGFSAGRGQSRFVILRGPRAAWKPQNCEDQ